MVSDAAATDAYQQSARCLGIVENRPVLLGSLLPTDEITAVLRVPVRAIGDESGSDCLTNSGKDRNGVEVDAQSDVACARDVRHVAQQPEARDVRGAARSDRERGTTRC